MPAETEVGVMFPTLGVDVTCEYGRQPADTTPAGANVRAYEPGAERARGGSRTGLTKYVADRVNGDSPVQHLAVLVDPQAPALARDTDGTLPDPSTNNLRTRVPPGRKVRAGGSGVWPVGNDQDTGSGARLIQSVGASGTTTVPTDPLEIPLSFSVAAAAGDVIVAVAITVSSGATQPTDTHEIDGGSLSFTQVDSYSRVQYSLFGGELAEHVASMWYAVAAGGETTVTLRSVLLGDVVSGGALAILKFRGVPATQFVDGGTASGTEAGTTFPVGTLDTVVGAGAVVCIAAPRATLASAPSGHTVVDGITALGNGVGPAVTYRARGITAGTLSFGTSGAANEYVGICLALNG